MPGARRMNLHSPWYTAAVDELVVAFCSRISADLRASVDDDALARELDELVERARDEANGVELDCAAFASYVAERATFDARGKPQLRTLHAGDLWIAFGCVTGNAEALAAFERRFAPEIGSALRRSFEP